MSDLCANDIAGYDKCEIVYNLEERIAELEAALHECFEWCPDDLIEKCERKFGWLDNTKEAE